MRHLGLVRYLCCNLARKDPVYKVHEVNCADSVNCGEADYPFEGLFLVLLKESPSHSLRITGSSAQFLDHWI